MNNSSADIPVINPAGDTVRLVQMTDTHLCQQAGGELLGMDTDHSLQAVIDQVRRERSTIDLILGTGDLSDKGAREAYDRLEDYWATFSAPSFWLPGNHDDRSQMSAAAREPNRLSGELRAGNWQILLLDSQIPGQVGGELGEQELARLESALRRAREEGLYTLICMHHQPVKVGSEWLDEQMVADADAFWAITEQHPGARGVLWGHVHQQIERRRGDIELMASPSTCVQFAPNSIGFRADNQSPGYRWLDLGPDGRIDSGVSRVTGVKFQIDLNSDGYL